MVTCSMIIGLIFTPVGWVLLLAATVTPQWREFPQRPGYSLDLFFYDGLWETCREVTTLNTPECKPLPEEIAVSWWIQLQRATAIISVVMGALSYLAAHLGVRWWGDAPNHNLIGTAGVLISFWGVIYVCIVSCRAYQILAAVRDSSVDVQDKFRVGTCLYLGWLGGSIQVASGVILMCNFSCQGKCFIRQDTGPYEADY